MSLMFRFKENANWLLMIIPIPSALFIHLDLGSSLITNFEFLRLVLNYFYFREIELILLIFNRLDNE